MEIQIIPDWTKRFSKEQIKNILLEFNGEGWYYTKTDSLLVLNDKEDMYWCYCWNSTGIREMMKQVHDLPIHIDTRG